MRRTTLALAISLVLAACGSDKRPASTGNAADAALAERWVALHGEYAAAMEEAAGDCARAALAVRKVNAKNADLLATGKPRMAALRRDSTSAKWLDDATKKQIGGALDRMAPTLDSCRGNADLSAALAEGAFERSATVQPR
ncbi:MAG TPA: hypothetical protein VIG06_20125 [Kofleriaceae bacterium]|jgi:hypothetical protein